MPEGVGLWHHCCGLTLAPRCHRPQWVLSTVLVRQFGIEKSPVPCLQLILLPRLSASEAQALAAERNQMGKALLGQIMLTLAGGCWGGRTM